MTNKQNSLHHRQELILHCLTYAVTYEDYPFGDDTATIWQGGNRCIFALFIKHNGQGLLNLKTDPITALYWRGKFKSVIPGWHMNKVHWNSVILDGTVPDDAIKQMIAESYELTKPKSIKSNAYLVD